MGPYLDSIRGRSRTAKRRRAGHRPAPGLTCRAISLRVPIGYSDSLQLRRANLRYVDKSAFIINVLRSAASVMLVPRPRRFGRTLNLPTLAAYVERTDEDRTEFFQDLAVWHADDGVRAQFGRARVPATPPTCSGPTTMPTGYSRGCVARPTSIPCAFAEGPSCAGPPSR